MNQYK